MNIYQKQILGITVISFLIFLFLSVGNVAEKIYWVRWYRILSNDEKKKYNPFTALKRIRIVLFSASVVGLLGLLSSIYIYQKLTTVTFVMLIIAFIIQIPYAGPKNNLIDDEINIKNR